MKDIMGTEIVTGATGVAAVPSLEEVARAYHRVYHGLPPWEDCQLHYCPAFRAALGRLRAEALPSSTAEGERLIAALAFAAEVIKSGTGWTEECERRLGADQWALLYLRELVAFATVAIHAGEGWTTTCEFLIGRALRAASR